MFPFFWSRMVGNAKEEVVESFGHWPRSGVAGSCGRFFKKCFVEPPY